MLLGHSRFLVYESFFVRSAQRLFIAKDRRFLPAGVMPSRFLPFVARLRAGVAESLESKTMA
jgi:hypothetical protein